MLEHLQRAESIYTRTSDPPSAAGGWWCKVQGARASSSYRLRKGMSISDGMMGMGMWVKPAVPALT